MAYRERAVEVGTKRCGREFAEVISARAPVEALNVESRMYTLLIDREHLDDTEQPVVAKD
jgi:hypothetical protein